MKIVSFLIAFVIFSIVILFHELGHFLLAKANGIRVNEFCFGLGPTICGIQKGETKYCIKAFPISLAHKLGISVWRSLHDGRGRRRFDGQSCIW